MAVLAVEKEVELGSAGWAGGVNVRDSIDQLERDQARVMNNGLLDERGGFSKRLGCLSQGTFGVTADRVLSQYVFYRANTNPQIIINTSAGVMYYTNDPTANPIVWTQMRTGLDTARMFSFETFNGKCYMSNGVNDYAWWDGAALATFASAPKGRYLRLWKDTMWVSGVDALPDRVYSSDAGNADSFPVANWVDIGKGDGDRITALATDGLYLIPFKLRRHMLVFDPVSFANRVVDGEKGSEGHWSVVTAADGVIYFLSRRGICRYFGDAPSVVISGNLEPMFDPSILNFSRLTTAWAYTVGSRVGWVLPEVGQNFGTVQIEYYPTLSGQRGIGPFNFQKMPVSNVVRWRYGTQELFYGAHQSANKYLQILAPVGMDDGQTFTAMLETAPVNFGAPTVTKYIRRAHYLGRGKLVAQFKRNFQQQVYRSFALDFSTVRDIWNTSDLWGKGSWGPGDVYATEIRSPDAYGRYFTMVFTDSQVAIGEKLIIVADKEYRIDQGEWGIYNVVLNALVLGERES